MRSDDDEGSTSDGDVRVRDGDVNLLTVIQVLVIAT